MTSEEKEKKKTQEIIEETEKFSTLVQDSVWGDQDLEEGKNLREKADKPPIIKAEVDSEQRDYNLEEKTETDHDDSEQRLEKLQEVYEEAPFGLGQSANASQFTRPNVVDMANKRRDKTEEKKPLVTQKVSKLAG